ncbi:MAG: radical SAM protein [Nitrospirae bacterium]|nr:MAG: radical SAM protein [Nitrospirota bacterium]
MRLSIETKEIVCRDGLRKYYRFRPARFYGGISTADCVGCCLRCVFCWSWNIVSNPEKHGNYYSPEDVVRRLEKIAKKKHFKQMRISGNEPTICMEHLIRVLELIESKFLFILETNGILIGYDEAYAKALSRFKNIYVRVSLKGTCKEEFTRLTKAIPEGFSLQLKALEHLYKYGVRCHPACMISFSPKENIEALRGVLKGIHPDFEDFEIEELILYPHIEERLKRLGIKYYTAYRPDNIPTEQI